VRRRRHTPLGRGGVEGGPGAYRPGHPPAADGAAQDRTGLRLPVTDGWTRSASALETSTRSAAGEPTKRGDVSIRPASFRAGGCFRTLPSCAPLLSLRRDAFARCLTEKMLTYALGRGLERADRRDVDRIMARLARDGYRFSTLVLAVVEKRVVPGARREVEDHENRATGYRGGRFLRGVGAAVALPFLEAMNPGKSAGGERGAPVAHGLPLRPKRGTHAGLDAQTVGMDFELPAVLQPLQPFKDDLLVLSGLTLDKARAHGDGGGDHARANVLFPDRPSPTEDRRGRPPRRDLRRSGSRPGDRASHPLPFPGDRLRGGQERRRMRPRLQLCLPVQPPRGGTRSTPVANGDQPAACLRPSLRQPGRGVTAARPAPRGERQLKSILDFVADDAKQLEASLGVSDRHKLDEYLTGVARDRAAIGRALPAVDLRRAKCRGRSASRPTIRSTCG